MQMEVMEGEETVAAWIQYLHSSVLALAGGWCSLQCFCSATGGGVEGSSIAELEAASRGSPVTGAVVVGAG